MQSNTLYAHVDDMWMSGWSTDPTITADPNGSGDFNDPDLYASSSARYGFDASQYQPEDWDTQPAYTYNQEASYSYSAAFNHSDFVDPDGNVPDFDLVASDGVHFAVTATKLRSSSSNDFGGLLASPTASAFVYLTSPVLNLVLHGIYDLSPSQYAPTASDLAAAVDSLEQYGLSNAVLVADKTPLFQSILMRAPVEPLACYTLAARAELEDLAVLISSYTLSLSLPDITDEAAAQIGPRYLKRLFFLHLGRVEALKRILFPPPDLHPSTDNCKAKDQRPVGRAWTMAVAEMSWDLNPNISGSALDAHLGRKREEFGCPECRGCLTHRIKRLLVEWSLVKSTI